MCSRHFLQCSTTPTSRSIGYHPNASYISRTLTSEGNIERTHSERNYQRHLTKTIIFNVLTSCELTSSNK